LPLRESRKNLGGILWWPFVGLKQQFADLLCGAKNLGARCKADARHDRVEMHKLSRVEGRTFDGIDKERYSFFDKFAVELLTFS
jgi:hypothetical protein